MRPMAPERVYKLMKAALVASTDWIELSDPSSGRTNRLFGFPRSQFC